MTVIAYKDGVMACDSAWSSSGTIITRATKIKRLKSGALFGASGDDDSRALEELFEKVKTPSGMPTRKQLLELAFDCSAIIVLPSGRIFRVDIDEPQEHHTHWTGGLFEVNENYHTIGSGSVHAMTAMACGKSAREAVQHAINVDIYCRAPIYTLPLKPIVKVKKATRKKK